MIRNRLKRIEKAVNEKTCSFCCESAIKSARGTTRDFCLDGLTKPMRERFIRAYKRMGVYEGAL